MPVENIQVDPDWGFEIKSTPEYPLLIEFDNFDGIRKPATPAFLLALLLKHHLKAIKSESSGKKPSKLGFYVFTKLKPNERKRVGEKLKDACNLLNIEFVDVKIV